MSDYELAKELMRRLVSIEGTKVGGGTMEDLLLDVIERLNLSAVEWELLTMYGDELRTPTNQEATP